MTVYLLNLVNEMHSLTANHVDNFQLIARTRTIDAAITTRTNICVVQRGPVALSTTKSPQFTLIRTRL